MYVSGGSTGDTADADCGASSITRVKSGSNVQRTG